MGYIDWFKVVPALAEIGSVEDAEFLAEYNQSSFVVTQRYLGIEQDDRDNVFKTVTI